MMKKTVFCKKRILCLILCLAFGMTIISHAETTKDKLDHTAGKIDELEQEKQEKEDELENLNQHKSNLTGELGELDNQLYQISVELDQLDRQLADTDAKIAKKEKSIQRMEKKSRIQYQNMKKRIKYTYENGQDSLLEILFSSTSIADFLNRSEYATAITAYDRKMLDLYVEMLHRIEGEKAALEEKRREQAALKQQKEDKQSEVHTLIAEKKQKLQTAEGEIADTQSEIDHYKNELEKQRAYEEELEKKKAAEDAARLEEIRKQEAAGNQNHVVVVPAEGDEALLAALIECEAGGESYEGKLAVGSVVMNRVESAYFPNTVVGVIYQSGQFSPVASGRFATVLAKGAESSCVQAAREVLAGKRTINALYFRRNNGTINGTVIGNHVFY